MGYDIHITRKEFWATNDNKSEITLEEWMRFIENQNDLILTNLAKAQLQSGEILQYKNEGIALWTGYSKGNKNGEVYFNYSHGNISVKNPDDEVLKYVCDIAIKLNAIVQGDDGEIYVDGKII